MEHCCQAWLDEQDRRQAALLRNPTTRNQHVIGRGMSRRLLSDHQLDPRSIRFAVGSHGKPVVADPPQARRPFNVTHTDGLVLCGIGDLRHQTIGLDVERLGRRTKPELAERYFSKPEIEILRRCPDEPSQRRTFLRIWTLKESFIKALGTGLAIPLADFAFAGVGSDQPTIRLLNPALQDELHWRFYSFEPKPGFVAALAVAASDETQLAGTGYALFDFATQVPRS